MIATLNLNHPELVTERQVMIEALDHDLNDGTPPELLVQDFLDTDPDGARPASPTSQSDT